MHKLDMAHKRERHTNEWDVFNISMFCPISIETARLNAQSNLQLCRQSGSEKQSHLNLLVEVVRLLWFIIPKSRLNNNIKFN